MRSSDHQAAGLDKPGKGTGGKAHAAIQRPSPHPLTFPRVSKHIKKTIDPGLDIRAWAKLALLWLENGEIPGDAHGSPRELVENALSRWASQHCADIQHMGNLSIGAGTTSEVVAGYDTEEPPETPDTSHWYISIVAGEVMWYAIGAGLSAIEKAHPDLGRTTIRMIEMASLRTINAYTPSTARDLASILYWDGIDCQEDFAEAAGQNALSQSEIDERFTPNKFDSRFPPWALPNRKGEEHQKLLADEYLSHLAAHSAEPLARAVACLLMEMQELIKAGAKLPGVELDPEPVYFGHYLRWDNEDPLIRVFDDHIEYANDCAEHFTDLFCLTRVPLDTDGFGKWKTKMEQGFTLLSKLDRLIGMIAKPIESEGHGY